MSKPKQPDHLFRIYRIEVELFVYNFSISRSVFHVLRVETYKPLCLGRYCGFFTMFVVQKDLIMTDNEFKALPHTLKRYMQYKNGQKAEDGYSPDFLLKHEDKEHYIIIEFEKNASRKCLLGDMVKAAHFLCGDKAGYMVLVVEAEHKSKKAEAVATHLRFYFHWLKKITHLRRVWVISIDDYMDGEAPLPIKSKQFKNIATCV